VTAAQNRLMSVTAYLAALIAPIALWHRVVEVLAEQPRWTLHYLTGWLPWALLAGGLAFLLPVTWSAGMSPESRWFPRARGAYTGWGISLYLLGLVLAWQVARIQGSAFS
jgi:hypothetical protein